MPRLRRLLHPHRRATAHAGARRAPRGHGVRVGDRLRSPVPVLHEHLRPARHPRAFPGGGHRSGHGQGRPACVGGWRRRRHDVDRRQPPDPRAAPQREPEHPAVQQPDLRADQGAVLAHQRAGQGDQVNTPRLGGATLQRGVAGAGAEASFVARTHDMDRGHMQEMFRRAHDHPGAALVEVFQNCNVFNDGAFAAITKRDAASRC